MNRTIRSIIAVTLAVFMLAMIPANLSYAYGTDVEYFDFQDSTISVAAGSTHTMELRAGYDYTYYIKGSTSQGTYLEGSFKGGTHPITFHIGADETGKNIFFYFYVADDRVSTTDKYDVVEVYVQPAKGGAAAPAAVSNTVTLAGGKTGSVAVNNNIAMLNSDQGIGMASFSLSDGNGHMLPFAFTGIVNNGSNYFNVACAVNYAAPKISESDKAVMLANGYAGVCVNGNYKNWP